MNSACIQDGGRLCILFAFYRPQDTRGAFRGTVARWDSPEGWAKKIEGLGFLEPAKPATFGDLGVEGFVGNPNLVDHEKQLTALTFKKKLERMIKRACDRETFEKRNAKYGTSLRFETSFGGEGLFRISDDGWRFAERMPVATRRKKRIIY